MEIVQCIKIAPESSLYIEMISIFAGAEFKFGIVWNRVLYECMEQHQQQQQQRRQQQQQQH